MPTRDFLELERLWYGRLKDSGFIEIERVADKDRPLERYHSFDLVSEESQNRKESRTPYQAQIDSFADHPQFPELVRLMAKHGNNKFTESGIIKIWDLHREALSERQIAQEMSCSRSCITFLLRRVRAWMILTV